ncbi:Dapper 2 [Merluccius polli]|uniref:Dapper 2 n=1 Tax=Merluccius polli TaxID=89951 RepID=A0AA47NUL9_MERPO|nr:Dapper 2 [Merluccius polli]
MLSLKVCASGSGVAAAGAGGDHRGRVAERLRAALAGLHELHVLREKQGDMVTWALRADREEARAGGGGSASGSVVLADEEQRLEATLTALKQQLSRLRRQDVGLKTHLQQLGQQISDLKIDVNKVSTDQLESDSRPSSGFYELSDGGSCSLSNSCTSIYSECLSSSQTSLLQSPMSPPSSHNTSPPINAEACWRRPGDENAGRPTLPRTSGLHLGSSRIRTGAVGPERPRPRPVSTGDLDRMVAAGPGCYKSVPGKKPTMGPVPRTSTLDSKFQSSLMSRNGTEVYHYPSPLHAVALQSPIFAFAGELSTMECQGPSADAGPSRDDLQKGQVGPETKYLGYIGKLLQRNTTTRTSIQSEQKRDTQWICSEHNRELSDNGTACPIVESRGVPLQPIPTGALDINSLEAKWERECSPEQGSLPTSNPALKCQAPESLQRYSYPAAIRECSAAQANTSTTVNHNNKLPAEHSALARSHSEKRHAAVRETRVVQKKCPAQKPVLAHSSSTEDHLGWDPQASSAAAPNDFVHAKFVPAGSQRVKVRQADRKTKAVKLRRKTSEKPRAVRHQQGYSSGERARESQGSGSRGEVELRRSGKEKVSPRLGEQRRHSGSDSSLCGPGLMHPHRVHPKPISFPAVTKSGKGRRTQRLEPEQPMEQRRRRQGTGKWPVDVEVFQATCTPRTREPYTHVAATRQMVHATSARPHSGQWVGPSRSYKPPVSSSCFFSALNTRYPPAPYPAGSRYPPRCESEYSAECASLFHSTIAASSVGDLSDDTTNHFGDSESSQSFQSHSDSDSSLSLEDDDDQVHCPGGEGGALVWAQSAQGPAVARVALQRPPHPERPACRIKASRALKKKIRRFQPASLKVMTLV